MMSYARIEATLKHACKNGRKDATIELQDILPDAEILGHSGEII